MKYTAIVILNYNNYQDTINCINSVLKYNTAEVKFFVVDNGSPDMECVPTLDIYFKETFKNDYLFLKDGEALLQSVFPRLTFIVSDVNDGYACGNNKALKYIQNDTAAEYILILNNDILFIQDIIPRLMHNLVSIPNAAIVSPLLLKKDGESFDYNCARKNVSIQDLIIQNLRIAFRLPWKSNDKFYILKTDESKVNTDAFEIDLPSGSCMLVNKKIFTEIGFFDPNTFLYYEENILYKKVHRIGLNNYLIPKLKCIHLGAQTIKKQKKNYKQFAMSSKSMKYYVWHYSDANSFMKIIFQISYILSHVTRFISSNVKRIIKK